jgi:hypothetical protein
MSLLARSLDKIEQREVATSQQRGAIAKALADVELNEAEDEWKANPGILVAYTREGESRPLWFVKRGSQTEKRLWRCTSFGKNIVKFA